jgi:rhamnose transport system ATP-binding protein
MPSAALSILSVVGVQKSFGAVRALVDGSIDLFAGEAHALLGENGAGKSTLVKILAGVHRPDAGAIYIDGQRVSMEDPAAARDAGIAIIYQEPNLFPDLSVAENVFMGRQPLRSGRRIDTAAMHGKVAAVLDRLGVHLDPGRISRGLSIADQQIVEIAKALTLDARVIVMDEPTAALSAVEVDRLFRVVNSLRADGAAVMFISHRLEEVYALCQRVTVMRDGAHVVTKSIESITAEEIVRAMVGRDVVSREAGEHRKPGEIVLDVRRLSREGAFADVTFQIRSGEIVSLAGLVGAGRSEVACTIFGIERRDAGSVVVDGRLLKSGSPNAAMEAGVGFVPEDRRQQGLVMSMSIASNIALASLARLRRRGLVRHRDERRFASDWATRLQLKYRRLGDPASTLSGGNQQKIVLAKWLSRTPKLLIVDEPTRGIDIGTKAEVHRLLLDLAGRGVAILMISSELPEVLRLSDRILVMREGRLVAEFTGDQATEEAVVAAATGQHMAAA